MSSRIRFGEWCFYPDTLVISRGTYSTHLEPRVADLLKFFLAHPGEVHSHDRLINSVWEGRVVSDEAVRRGVSSLRQALSASGGDGLIQTIPKKGYMATFPTPESATDRGFPDSLRPILPRLAVAVSILVIAAAGNWLAWVPGAEVQEPIPGGPTYSIAILPFVDLSPQQNPDKFSEGLVEELCGLLSRYDIFRVSARTKGLQPQASQLDPRTLGNRLGVQYLIEGSIRRQQQQMRVAVTLVDARSGFRLWSQMYQRPVADLMQVQQEISQRVARTLQVVLVQGDVATVVQNDPGHRQIPTDQLA